MALPGVSPRALLPMTIVSSASGSTRPTPGRSSIASPGPTTLVAALWKACGGSPRPAAPVLCAMPRTLAGTLGARNVNDASSTVAPISQPLRGRLPALAAEPGNGEVVTVHTLPAALPKSAASLATKKCSSSAARGKRADSGDSAGTRGGHENILGGGLPGPAIRPSTGVILARRNAAGVSHFQAFTVYSLQAFHRGIPQ